MTHRKQGVVVARPNMWYVGMLISLPLVLLTGAVAQNIAPERMLEKKAPFAADRSRAATLGAWTTQHALSALAGARESSFPNGSTEAVYYQIARGSTAALRTCPASFFVLGARKGGTTSLFVDLCQHPRVAEHSLDKGSQTGEVGYFGHDKMYSKGAPWYAQHFPIERMAARLQEAKMASVPPLIAGDASVDALVSSLSAQRVARACPSNGVRFIVLLREPMERMYSQYLMRLRLGVGGVTPTTRFAEYAAGDVAKFRHAVAETERGGTIGTVAWHRRADPPALFAPSVNAVYEGCYAPHLLRWLRVFDRSQLLILLSDDFFADAAGALRQALRHLGLPEREPLSADARDGVFDAQRVAQTHRNANLANTDDARGDERWYDPQIHGLDAQSKAVLHTVFAPYNEQLATLLGRKLPWTGSERSARQTERRARRFLV